MSDMSNILKMVKAGRLTEATAQIQEKLSQTAPARGMKDVTPAIRRLAKPGAGAAGKAKRPRGTSSSTFRRIGDPDVPDGASWDRLQGEIPYRLYRPATSKRRAPLIVMLHGCTQNPEDFAAGTGMNAAAEAMGAHVLWPEQARTANANGCWNWFEVAHQGRGGEAAAITSTIQTVLEEIGPKRKVHVAGLSAGGAMAAILGAHYADIVTSIGVHSGLPVGAARDVGSAFAAMRSGGEARIPVSVPAIVFHGDADRTVAPSNADALLPGGAARAATEIGGRAVVVRDVPTPGHRRMSEAWNVDGLGHAWSGGDSAGTHTDPAGPDATAEMMRFFASI